MTDDQKRPGTDVLGGLPRSRPHRRSPKRADAAIPVAAKPGARDAAPAHPRPLHQPPQPQGLPPTPPAGERPAAEEPHDLLTGTVRAAAELTEIGLTASARMLRAAVSWLPRR